MHHAMETGFVPLDTREYPPDQMAERAAEFAAEMARRRSVRHFSDRAVPRPVIEECLRAAGSAPSGANMQPWRFVVVSDPAVKRQIREAAEAEERAFYERRAGEEWLDALAPLGTDWQKPFLETAPYLIAIFAQSYGLEPDGRKIKHYYVQESVGIATGPVDRGAAPCRPRHADAHAQPDGLPERDPGAPGQRAALPAAGRRLSGARRPRARYPAQSAERNRDIRMKERP